VKKDKITTKSVGPGFAQIEEDFVLDEQPMSRIVFRAGIHEGIRGRLIRQRRISKDDKWKDDKSIHIRDLKKGEGFNIELKTSAVAEFYQAIRKLASILKKQGVQYGEKEYTVTDAESLVITDKNILGYIKKILAEGYSNEVWSQLAEDEPDLLTKLSIARVQEEKKKVVEEFKERLTKGEYSETTGDNSWQKWIFEQNWLFGNNYQKPIEKAKINLLGIMPDYLFPTLDGFVDILEIKLPSENVILEDLNHKGSWKWCGVTNEAIGQVVNYLAELDRMRLDIERELRKEFELELLILKPRAYILIGDSLNWTTEKKEGLRNLNSSLHEITVITYRDLCDRAEHLANLNNEDIKLLEDLKRK
jgi:hypothetical protein